MRDTVARDQFGNAPTHKLEPKTLVMSVDPDEHRQLFWIDGTFVPPLGTVIELWIEDEAVDGIVVQVRLLCPSEGIGVQTCLDVKILRGEERERFVIS